MFADWCAYQAHSNAGIVEQLKKLPGMGLATRAIEKKYATEILALGVVESILRNTESVSLSKESADAE